MTKRRQDAPVSQEALDFGTEIRRRRLARKVSLRTAAARAGIAFGYLAGIERGENLPHPDVAERLRQAVGATMPVPVQPLRRVDLGKLAADLGAMLAVMRQVPLAPVANRYRVPLGDVRQALAVLDAHLAPCGMRVLDDGTDAALDATQERREAGAIDKAPFPSLTSTQLEVLAFVTNQGQAVASDVKEWRQTDSSGLLEALVDREYLVREQDGAAAGQPWVYRLGPRALRRFGVRTPEEAQAWFRDGLGAKGILMDATTRNTPMID